jgi:diguanylate cyclase (GGDEF)-like protein
MRKDTLIVQDSVRLEEVSRELTRRPSNDFSHDFIIVRNEMYLGVGRTRDLLVKITEQQIHSARYSNPLTMLPGSVPLHDFIDSCLQKTQPIIVAYFDINFFKPYNDIYGYSLGDSVIVRFAEHLRSLYQREDEMIGHIGGDDFIAVMVAADWQSRLEQTIEWFDAQRSRFYKANDIEANGIWSEDRRGGRQYFSLMSLAIGVVQPDHLRCVNHHEVASLVSEAKKHAKQLSHENNASSLYVSRRRGSSEPMLI